MLLFQQLEPRGIQHELQRIVVTAHVQERALAIAELLEQPRQPLIDTREGTDAVQVRHAKQAARRLVHHRHRALLVEAAQRDANVLDDGFEDGTYSAVLDSPDNPSIKNVAASSISLTDTALKLAVASLSGSYSGTVKGSTIEGQWSQPGGNLPLTLSPYQKPALSKAELDQIVGSWNGPLQTPNGSLTFVLRFKAGAQGDLEGTLAVPEQGGNEFPMSEVEFGNGKLSFKIAPVRGDFRADYANGTITGVWKQPSVPPEGFKVSLKRGDVGAKKYVLKLSGDAFAKVSAAWHGTLTVKNPQGAEVALPLLLRFFTDERAEMMGALDSPSQKAMDIPITEASLNGNQLVLKVAAVGAEYWRLPSQAWRRVSASSTSHPARVIVSSRDTGSQLCPPSVDSCVL